MRTVCRIVKQSFACDSHTVIRTYLLVGLLWSLGQLAYVVLHPLVGDLVRERMACWGRGAWVGCFVACALVALLWPVHVVLTFSSSRIGQVAARQFRREFLDREGLLEPQAPPPRCLVHDAPLAERTTPCFSCGAPIPVLTCRGCVVDFEAAAGVPWEPGSFQCAECQIKNGVLAPPGVS